MSRFGGGPDDRQSRARRAGYDPEVLAGSTVIVVGVGALGQNVLLDLGLTGLRELRIVDGDVFEDHNLTRSPLFPPGTGAVGAKKVGAVGARLASIHTAADPVVRIADAWIEELGLGAFEGVDVIAACVDSLHARSYLARVALLLDLPIVDGGFSGANIGMTAYPADGEPSERPCWSCGGPPTPGAFSCRQAAEFATTSGAIPAIQNGAAALGGLCAEAIVMMLHGRITQPRRISLDIRSGESLVSIPGPAPECAANHRRLASATASTLGPEATVRELLAVHGSGESPMLFLPDVFVERATCPRCHGICAVDAPTHRWRRDPHCRTCGGPWERLLQADGGGQEVILELDLDHPRADEPLLHFGVRPGDIVELSGDESVTLRIAGDTATLWDGIS